MITKKDIEQRLQEAWDEAYALQKRGKDFTETCKKTSLATWVTKALLVIQIFHKKRR